MGILSDINRKRKKATKQILNPFVKGISKVSDKLIPNELRFAMPYAAGIGTLALPPGWGPYMRSLAAMGINTAGQIAADETPIEDISDINKFSVALAGGLGAMGSDKFASNIRSGIESGMSPQEAANQFGRGTPEALAAEGTLAGGSTGAEFLQGAENVTREGLASLGDYVTGTRDTLANLGKHPGELMSLKGVKDAGMALGPTISHGTGDVAYETAIDLKDEQDRLDAEEAAEYGANEDRMKRERMESIRAGMEENNFSEEEIQVVFDRLGLGTYVPSEPAAQGGIIGLKNGGMLNLGGNEMDYRGGGFVPIGKRERADDVPARLSKNEFVMTADAVKAAGGGSVNKGAQRMYNVMNNLEARA